MTRPAQGSTLPSDRDRVPGLSGGFVEDGGDTWYRIDGIESTPPFFVALAGDSDLWVFASTAGSLTAGRRDPDGAFFPYETVDKLHRRWEHTGPRSWILVEEGSGAVLWEPFAPRLDGTAGRRSVWKNLSARGCVFGKSIPRAGWRSSMNGPARPAWASSARRGWKRCRAWSRCECSTACSTWCRPA